MGLATLYDALELAADGALAERKALDIEQLTNWIVQARPSMEHKAGEFAVRVRDGKVEKFSWQGTELDCNNGSNAYKTFTEDANKFALWEVNEGTPGTVGSNQSGNNQIDIITWAGLYCNYNIQALTLEDVLCKGKVLIQYGEQNGRPNRLVPLREFLIHPLRREFKYHATAQTEINAFLEFNGSAAVKPGFRFDPWEPMVVVTADSRPMLEIKGLTGTIPGSSPPFTLQLHAKGFRIRL